MSFATDLKAAARRNPFALQAAWKCRNWIPTMRGPHRKVVERGDDALIDGFPRSANTFAWEAFLTSQPRPLKVGNHFHTPAQFMLARKYGVPAMLVLREPLAAASSLVVFDEAEYTPRSTLRYFVDFHRPLLAITTSFVIAPFEEVTRDFGKSIDRMNERFGTDFETFDHSEESARAIFDAMEARLKKREADRGADLKLRRNYPDALKERRRKEVAAAFDDPALASLKAEARQIYEQLMATL